MQTQVIYNTFEIEISGHKVGVSDDPKHTKRKDDLWKNNLWECYLIDGQYYATLVVSKEAFKDDNFKPFILVMLQKEINKLKESDISGSHLEATGWHRNGSTYTKGNDVITYDGCYWFLNGERINNINDLPQ